jgi:hypothetical protein
MGKCVIGLVLNRFYFGIHKLTELRLRMTLHYCLPGLMILIQKNVNRCCWLLIVFWLEQHVSFILTLYKLIIKGFCMVWKSTRDENG